MLSTCSETLKQRVSGRRRHGHGFQQILDFATFDRWMSACGHAAPRTCESEARRQRQFALGVGPQRQWKKVGLLRQTAVTIAGQPDVSLARFAAAASFPREPAL